MTRKVCAATRLAFARSAVPTSAAKVGKVRFPMRAEPPGGWADPAVKARP